MCVTMPRSFQQRSLIIMRIVQACAHVTCLHKELKYVQQAETLEIARCNAAYQNSTWCIASACCPHQLHLDRSPLPFSLPATASQSVSQFLALSLCGLTLSCL